jgi:hypothetical protein
MKLCLLYSSVRSALLIKSLVRSLKWTGGRQKRVCLLFRQTCVYFLLALWLGGSIKGQCLEILHSRRLSRDSPTRWIFLLQAYTCTIKIVYPLVLFCCFCGILITFEYSTKYSLYFSLLWSLVHFLQFSPPVGCKIDQYTEPEFVNV